MQRVTADHPWPLHSVASTRRMESAAAALLPPHTLMQRAGLAVARLALAVAPHARTLWVACGPGNNGGDGLEAALHLHRSGRQVVVTWLGTRDAAPADALASWQRATDVGVTIAAEPPETFDLAIDALLGIGARRPLEGAAALWRNRMASKTAPVLAVDVPSVLDADTGTGDAVAATHTLSLLTLKPGLFTAGGRDAAGQVWLDTLDVPTSEPADAVLAGPSATAPRPHASHKGSWGDVAVIGGAPGMAGAAVLAASAALHGGAGRVFLALLDARAPAWIAAQPELMVRSVESLALQSLHIACGCGGGTDIATVLPRVLDEARSLVLDADALNAIAASPALQDALRQRYARRAATVLTPHPLEAARLLGLSTAEVQADRLAAAQALVGRYGAVAVLKGSGTVVAGTGALPHVNPTGNARLATGGTGDVLAGLLAARLAAGTAPHAAAVEAAFLHGQAAQQWLGPGALTASALAAAF